MRRKLAKVNGAATDARRKTSMLKMLACGMLLGAGMIQSCDKDVLTGQPEWLGNSIYERLQEGIEVSDGSTRTFATTIKLIDDLGYTQTLSKTGSKTLFATPDDVFDEWFAENGLTYEQLTTTQKKQLFNNSLINNAYLLELMSNVSGNPPEEGQAMRRETSATIYDSIPTYKVADMPVNPLGDTEKDAWAYRRSTGRDVKMFKDATAAPMIHFLPDFMQKQNITSEDLSIITNGQSTSIEDSWINGQKVISSEQTCKNGYIYVIDGVINGTKNMAEIIDEDSRMSLWSSFLKRWSVPYPVTGSDLREYQTLNNTQDSVFNLRYYNASDLHPLLAVPNSSNNISFSESEVLLFDPGWNQYMYSNTTKTDMHYDAGMMIVPTDEALNDWFYNTGGKSLQQMYGTWDSIPYGTLVPLINVNMKESFIESVPSKFSSVLNDGQSPLGIEAEDIVESFMGCNGVVYLVDKVFAPVSYTSVIAPALFRSSGPMQIAYNIITGTYPSNDYTSAVMTQTASYDFTAYLNAMDSYFSLIIPANEQTSLSDGQTKVIRYIDPCSYGLASQSMFELSINSRGVLVGNSYLVTEQEDGTYAITGRLSTSVPYTSLQNRLYDMLDNNIIVQEITDDQEYYETKGGSIIRAKQTSDGMTFQGGYQLDKDEVITVADDNIYNMGEEGNGVTYTVCTESTNDVHTIDIPQTATKSVYQVLKEAAEAENSNTTLFYQLLAEDVSSSPMLKNTDGNYKCANYDNNYNISVFDSYNYTVYVPTDDAIQPLISSGYLPTWDDYNATSDEDEQDAIADRIHDFVRYHIQDRQVLINGEAVNNESYESAKLNTTNNRFYAFTVNADKTSYTVEDQLGNVRHVLTDDGFYNKICREYWISGMPSRLTSSTNTASALISSSSNAVVHKIDGVLLFDQSQLTRWK